MSQPAPQAVPQRTPRAERTRQRILEAAGQCFASAGFAKTTVEAIAARAGVSKGIVYHHYRGKEQILELVLETTMEEWSNAARLDEALARGGSVLDAIREVHRGSVAFAREHPLVQSLFQLDNEVLLTLANSRTVRESLERHRVNMIHALQVGIERGELRAELNPERAADIVRLHYMAILDHLFDPQWIDVTDDLIDTGLDILFMGLATGRPSSSAAPKKGSEL